MIRFLPKLKFASALFAGLVTLFCARPIAAQVVITNVSVVNVTLSTFSVVWAGSASVSPSISIFSDAGGTSNLTTQLGIQWYPLNAGDPTITNSYYRRQNQTALQQATASQGLVQVRVLGCAPNTTYYYKLQVTSTNGQTNIWPTSGPLPSVTTALENDFVVESQQVILTIPGLNPAGGIVILSNSNTPSLLAGVVGDGVASNEVFFSVSDLLAANGQTNYLPQAGAQHFTAEILNASSRPTARTFDLNFTGNFLVGSAQSSVFAQSLSLSLGFAALQTGHGSNVPITLKTSGSISNFSFVLNFPTNRFSSLTLQPLAPQVANASLQSVGANSLLLSFTAAVGQVFQGNLPVAQLNFTTASNQSSAFVTLTPQTPQGLNADGSFIGNFGLQSGQVVIIGQQPLLQSQIISGGSRQLVLYGNPGNSYQIQSSVKPQNAGWENVQLVSMTNLIAMINGLDESQSVIFYRAELLSADPPTLTSQISGQTRLLQIHGLVGTNYGLQYATNLSAPVTWYPLLSYKLTNAFQSITNPGGSTNPVIYYRLKKQ